MNKWTAFLLASVCAVGGAAFAADMPVSAASQPTIKPRVIGGSPADADFRAAIQKSGDDFRAVKAACRKRPSAERSACLKEANDVLKKARADAKTTHDQAKKQERAAKK